MTATLDLSETQTLTALRTVLLGVLPAGVEVIRAEINRVAEPSALDFVLMTPMGRTRLETNIDTFNDPALTLSMQQNTQVTVQLDIHGPASADNVQIVATTMRDGTACDAFTATGYAVQPLYAEDPRQSPFINGEQQFEFRWTVDVVLQANPAVTVAQTSATTVTVGIISVDATYPP